VSRAERVCVWCVAVLLVLVLADVAASVRQIANDYRSLNVEEEEEPVHLNPQRA
jgi:hypothetical protein